MTDSTQPVDPLVQQALDRIDAMLERGEISYLEARIMRVEADKIPQLEEWRREGRHFHMPSLGPYTDENPNVCLTCRERINA